MQRSFVAFALVVFCLCAASDATAQDAPQRLFDVSRLSEPQMAAQIPLRPPRAQQRQQPDPVKDGLIKGAVAGLIVAVLLDTDIGEENLDLGAKDWAAMIAMGAGYGLVIDFLHPSRQPGARPGPHSPGIAAKMKLRF